MQKKKTSPVFWFAFIAAVIAIFLLVTPQDTAKKTTVIRPPTQKKVVATLFTPEDYTAKFETVTSPPKNAFRPLVVKTTSGGGIESTAPNAIALDLTGGEAGWTYTGTAEVNGHIQAVVENPGTGQGDFLSIGQRWKKSKVISITDSSLTLQGNSGNQVTIKMQGSLGGGTTIASGFSPVNVKSALSGQIGKVAIQPEGNPGPTVAIEGEGNAN